jgi:hypothetical protein
MMIVAKIDGRMVQVMRVAHTVGFSNERDWVMVCFDFEQSDRRKQQFKWIPASTRFEWVREYNF